jgi:hypothetical protein
MNAIVTIIMVLFVFDLLAQTNVFVFSVKVWELFFSKNAIKRILAIAKTQKGIAE